MKTTSNSKAIAGLVAIVMAFEPALAASHTYVKGNEQEYTSSPASRDYDKMLKNFSISHSLEVYLRNLDEIGKKIVMEYLENLTPKKDGFYNTLFNTIKENKTLISMLIGITIFGVPDSYGLTKREINEEELRLENGQCLIPHHYTNVADVLLNHITKKPDNDVFYDKDTNSFITRNELLASMQQQTIELVPGWEIYRKDIDLPQLNVDFSNLNQPNNKFKWDIIGIVGGGYLQKEEEEKKSYRRRCERDVYGNCTSDTYGNRVNNPTTVYAATTLSAPSIPKLAK